MEGISIVKIRERRGIQVHIGTTEKGIYQTLEATSNNTSIFCKKEGWEEKNGIRISVSQ